MKQILNSFNAKDVIINLGSGPTVYLNREDIINIDRHAFKEVDVVSDVLDMPFEDSSIDLILNIALTEHVKQPSLLSDEANRVLKSGGTMISL